MVSFEVAESTLDEVLSNLSVLLEEAIVEFGEDGMAVNGVDAAEVALTDLQLPADAFESFDSEDTAWGVDIDQLGRVVGMADSGQTIAVEEGDTGQVRIEIEGLEYTMSLIDPSTIREGQEVPDLDFDAECVVDASVLQRGVTASDMVSDHLRFEVNDDGEFVITASGDTDDVELNTAEEDGVSVDFDGTPDPCSAIFSLDYMKDIIGALPASASVDLQFGDDMLVVLSAPIADESGMVTYALAPRIQSN